MPETKKTKVPASRIAYIAAPAKTDTKLVEESLKRRGVTPVTAEQAARPGEVFAAGVLDAVRRSDMLVAILGPPAASGDVLFEMGLARGLNKPTLLVVSPGGELPLISGSGVPYIRTRPDNQEAIDFGIGQLLRAVHHGTKQAQAGPPATVRAPSTKAIGDRADELLALLRNDRGEGPDKRLEDVVTNALAWSGVNTMSKGVVKDAEVDLAAWVPDLEPLISNPVLIDLRVRLESRPDIDQINGQFLRVMRAFPNSFGLVIYFLGKKDVIKAYGCLPQVAMISAEEFVERLRSSSFATLLWSLRNEQAHRGL
jgi:hypothetical protein